VNEFNPTRDEKYVKRMAIDGGIYSGYNLNDKRQGPGTWVNADATKRFEGLWNNDHFCVGIGRLEFNDGSLYEGKFIEGKHKPKVSTDFLFHRWAALN